MTSKQLFRPPSATVPLVPAMPCAMSSTAFELEFGASADGVDLGGCVNTGVPILSTVFEARRSAD